MKQPEGRKLANALTAVAAFALGLVAILVLMAMATRARDGGWLPPALTLVFWALLGLLPEVRKTVPRAALTAALGGGVCALWAISEPPSLADTERFFVFLPPLAGIVVLVAALLAPGAKLERPAQLWTRAALLVALAWLVAYFSSSNGGAGGMLRFMVTSLGVPARFAETVLVPLRKTIHFTFYGCVGLAAWNLAQASLAQGPKQARRLAFGLLFALSVASFDEARQSTQPGRTGAVTDVLLDMAGAATFVGIAEFAVSRKRNPAPS
jgi:VanZ family protein